MLAVLYSIAPNATLPFVVLTIAFASAGIGASFVNALILNWKSYPVRLLFSRTFVPLITALAL